MKICKEDHPIRPKTNWMNAPADKFAKHLVRTLEQHAALPYSINVRNTVALLTGLKDIKLHKDMRHQEIVYKNPPPTRQVRRHQHISS